VVSGLTLGDMMIWCRGSDQIMAQGCTRLADTDRKTSATHLRSHIVLAAMWQRRRAQFQKRGRRRGGQNRGMRNQKDEARGKEGSRRGGLAT
jgi:hypothetical protein